jgi:hypothetical protein
MTLEVLVIAVVRIAGSLPVLRWPLAGALLAVAVDLSALFLMDLLDLGGVPDYQALDKWLDQVYLAAFLVVALRWAGPSRAIAVALYGFRMVGFVIFELTGAREVLIVFPNVFELWFLVVTMARAIGREPAWTPARIASVGAVLLVLKETQEWALHGARLFDQVTALEAVRQIWAWLVGR